MGTHRGLFAGVVVMCRPIARSSAARAAGVRREFDDNLRRRVVVRDIGELHVQIAVVGRELRESHVAALGGGVNLFE